MSLVRRSVGALGFVGAIALMMAAGGGDFISSEKAKTLVKEGALLLDVRSPAEFAAGHIEGAVNIPVQELEAKLGTFPAKKEQNVVVYCQSGRRSAKAREILQHAGYLNVFNLGGISNWK